MADEELGRMISAACSAQQAYNPRQHLLSDAVRIDQRLLPDLAAALEEVKERAQIDVPLEAYVHAQADINAAVMPGRERTLVLLSSGAVEHLSREELDFVIGHELGHALFGHLAMPVMYVLERTPGLKQKQAMRLLAWHRAAEISADRAGLVCTGSLSVAARTMFKTLSGLKTNFDIDPHEFAEQWTELAEEVRIDARGDVWMAPHPFPPLRMKALIAFWGSESASKLIKDSPGGQTDDEADTTIGRWLDLMNPLAREQSVTEGKSDPLLTGFVLWAALHVASTNGAMVNKRVQRLKEQVGSDSVTRALGGDVASYRERFIEARSRRSKPLSAIELHRIFTSLAQIIKADGNVSPDEVEAMKKLAAECKIAASVIDRML